MGHGGGGFGGGMGHGGMGMRGMGPGGGGFAGHGFRSGPVGRNFHGDHHFNRGRFRGGPFFVYGYDGYYDDDYYCYWRYGRRYCGYGY